MTLIQWKLEDVRNKDGQSWFLTHSGGIASCRKTSRKRMVLRSLALSSLIFRPLSLSKWKMKCPIHHPRRSHFSNTRPSYWFAQVVIGCQKATYTDHISGFFCPFFFFKPYSTGMSKYILINSRERNIFQIFRDDLECYTTTIVNNIVCGWIVEILQAL